MSPVEVRRQTDKLPLLRPGQYLRTATIKAFEADGATPEQEAEFKSLMQNNQLSYCLTYKESEAGFRKMFGEMNPPGSECHYKRLSVEGSRIGGLLVCKGEQGDSSVDFTGLWAEEGTDLTLRLEGESDIDDPMLNSRQTLHVVQRRTGDCVSDGAFP